MSRSRASLVGRFARRRGERGFTLVEVIVSLGLLAVVAAAILPLILGGVRGVTVAKLSTQAKAVSQERIEQIRNLQFHVEVAAGPYRDLLDIYYRNRVAYSAAGNTNDRCDSEGLITSGQASFEPTPPFYKCVINEVPGFSKFSQVIATQFLSPSRQPVPPSSSYDSQVAGNDDGSSDLLGITVITSWRQFGGTKRFRLYTEVVNAAPVAPVVLQQLRVSGLTLRAGYQAEIVELDAGVVNADGSLSTAAESAANARGAVMGFTSGQRVDGAIKTVSAPSDPPGPSAVVSVGPRSFPSSSCDTFSLACIAGTRVPSVSNGIVNGLPILGDVGAPFSALLLSGGLGGNSLEFGNQPNRPELDLTSRLVVIPDVGGVTVSGTGFYGATNGSPHTVFAQGSATASEVRLFPTTTVPEGLIKVRYSADLRCETNGSATSVTGGFSGTLTYWRRGVGYLDPPIQLADSGGADPLASVPIDTIIVGNSPLTGAPLRLSDYVATWSSLTAVENHSDPNGKIARGRISGVLSLTSTPLRLFEDNSVVNVGLGSLTCLAEDNRP